jgi:hypothetical protein
MFNIIKNWSGWAEAGTIFKARMEMLGGLITAGLASVAAFSFIPYISGTVDWKILAAIAGYLFVTGAVGEYVRRYNATDL